LLALLEAEACASYTTAKEEVLRVAKRKSNNRGHRKQKHKATMELIQSPRMLCEIAVSLQQAELLSKPKRHGLAIPHQEYSNRLVTSVRPAPIEISTKVKVPACTVLVNSTQTIEESEHQRSMQQLRMELEAAHQSSMMQLRTQLTQVTEEYQSSIQEHQGSMQQLESQHQSSIQGHQSLIQQLESQSKLAQQEIDQLRAKTECAVCLDGERDAVLFPCMHASCCHKCSASLEQCPQCRSPVTKMLRIYSP